MIGIITYHDAHNYGAALQTFALFYYIKSEGKNVEVINYVPDYFQNTYANGFNNDSLVHILKNLKNLRKIQMRKSQVYKFNNFQKEYIEITSNIINNLSCLSDNKYQKIIFGSDQIWNNNINYNDSSYFGKEPIEIKVKCYSYAASLGTENLNEFQKINMIRYVSKFEKIGLRESNLISEIGQLIGRDVQWTLDPVFLLTKENWITLLKLKKGIIGKYILLYELKGNKELEQYCKEYAKKHNLKIINIHPTCNWRSKVHKQVSDVGPIDFISLIKDAELVCTDSFHATAFSIIFEKKYIAARKYVEDSRINSIVGLVDVERIKITDTELLMIDFSMSKNKSQLKKQIENSKLFLKLCL